jgi:hypothetical protein
MPVRQDKRIQQLRLLAGDDQPAKVLHRFRCKDCGSPLQKRTSAARDGWGMHSIPPLTLSVSIRWREVRDVVVCRDR